MPDIAVGGASARGGTKGLLETRLRAVGLSPSGLVVLLGCAATWGLARAIGGHAAFLLAYTALGVLIAAVFQARRRRVLEAERSSLPNRTRVGQTIEVELSLRSKGRHSSFLVTEHMHSLLGSDVVVPVKAVGPSNDVTHRYSFRPQLRGVYQVGPLAAEWNDPLGLARKEQILVPATEILVHPNTEAVLDRPLTRMWEDPPLRPPISKPWPNGFEFYGMRDYVPGDDLRRIVWKAVARTGKLLVRESEQGITDRIVIVLDTDQEWHSPGRPSETFEYSVQLAASVGAYHLNEGFSVTLEGNGAEMAKALRGPRARIALLDELAKVQLERAPLTEGIERLLRRSRSDSHTVVITPHLDNLCAGRLGLLIEAGASVLVVVVAWDEGDLMSVRRAREIGAQVVEIRPGSPMRTLFAHAVGAGVGR